ncbi:ABC-type transport auxiliary lipoprotein family protein [Halomonas sp. M1]|uniref:ABC-type transport auxiliary lipoprotein family protein n=1 Tax=Halomonas sp. M1 TaxID=3035470 RepID=UPI00248551F8|nr:ABC-type transport auxiliary lipoprotein family protein [Halomonas sp. M1]WFE71803.1 ABC-type transport auxiliary lipoprotein family protein [Halomonas sp. M1]
MSLRSPLTVVMLATLLLTFGGCSILPESEPATFYRLPASTPSATPEATSSALPIRLGIATPEAGHLLSSNRIVVYPERNVVNVYEGSRWHEDAPAMLQARLITGLQQRQLFNSVGSDRLPHDLLLLSELRHFQSEYDTTPPSVKIQLDVQLVGTQDRQPIVANSFSTRTQASSAEIPDVVDAFGQASDVLNEQLATWLEDQARSL